LYAQAAQDVAAGRPMSGVFAAYAPSILLHLLRAGEVTGRLADVFIQYASYCEERAEQRMELQKTLAYPTLLCFVIAALIAFLGRVVMPTFANLYAGLGFHPPTSLRIISDAFEMLPTLFIWFLLATLAFATTMFILLRRHVTWWIWIERWLPWQRILRLYRLRLLFTLLHLFLDAGVPLQEALFSLAHTRRVDWLTRQAHALHVQVMSGARLSDVFPLSRDLRLQSFIYTGERTGDFALACLRAKTHIQRQIGKIQAHITTYLEPAMLLFMGMVVTGAMSLVFLPMYQVISTISGSPT